MRFAALLLAVAAMSFGAVYTLSFRNGALFSTASAGPACLIKGNINASGEHIYHMPGQRYYDATRIDLWRGERWFCSESDANAAGFRRSRV